MKTPRNTGPSLDHQARLTAGQSCLDAALKVYLPLGLAVTCCCDPEHVGVGQKNANECDAPGKAPMHRWKALQTQLPTTAEIERRWQDFPYGNVGCVLGQASGVVRVDVDGPEGEALLAQWSAGDLPLTWVFRSSGEGRALLYAWPRDLSCRSTSQGCPGDHRELRLMAKGSQTVLPPSRHPSGRLYTWDPGCSPQDSALAPAPPWLIERLREAPRQVAPRHTASVHDAVDFARVASALAAIPNNDAPYDNWLALGTALQSTGESWARYLWDNWSRQSSKFDEPKQGKSWQNFSSDGNVTIASLFHLAKQSGWRPPQAARRDNGTGRQARTVSDMTGQRTPPTTEAAKEPSDPPKNSEPASPPALPVDIPLKLTKTGDPAPSPFQCSRGPGYGSRLEGRVWLR